MTSPTGPARVVVVGAGIAGLAAAIRLKQSGYAVTTLERDDHVGGRMRTVAHKGYRIDLGAIWLSRNYTHMVRLLNEAGLSSHVRPTSSLFGVVRDGYVHRLHADRRSDLARTRLLGWRSKLRALALLRDAHRADDLLRWEDLSEAAALDTEDAAAYARRRLNPELLEYLIDPLCRGFYFLPPDRVSAVGVLVALKTLFGSPTFNFADGVDLLPRLLAKQLDVQVGARVTGVEEHPEGVRVNWEDARHAHQTESAAACVLAVPAPIAAELAPGLTEGQRRYLADVRYLRDVHVYFGLTRPPGEAATFLLVPACENSHLTYLSFDHRRAPGRVPPGHGLVSVNLDGDWSRDHWSADDGRVTADALACLDNAVPQLAGHIRTYLDMTFVQRWDRAIIHRGPGEYDGLRDFTQSLDSMSRVQLAGDYFSFSATNAALATGERAAENVIRILDGGRIPARSGSSPARSRR